MAWGVGSWGIIPWGDAEESALPVFVGPGVLGADVWAADMISLTFSNRMSNNDDLKNASNYVITKAGSGNPVTVLRVLTTNLPNPNQIFLIVTPFTIGEIYTVTVSTSLRTTSNVELDASRLTGKWIGRRTKIDAMVQSRPQMYDTSPTSLLRAVLNAVGRQDDLLGGSRRDRLP